MLRQYLNLQGTTHTIQRDNLASGIYLYRVDFANSDQTLTGQLIVQ